MKKTKKILCFLLIASITVFSFAQSVSAQKNGFEINNDFCVYVSDEQECSEACTCVQKVLNERYGINLPIKNSENKCVRLIITGNPKDYSVTFNEANETVSILGGSSEALTRATYAFLTAACADSKGKKFIVTQNAEYSFTYSEDSVDNSSLLSYNGKNAKLVNSWSDGLLQSPEWIDTLVMTEVRLDTASIGGTFAESYDLLDFYASAGVNGIWLAPVYDRGTEGNGYGNFGPHTIDRAFTGTDDYDKGWEMLADFVSYAHSKGIYIFLDVITWGVMYNAPLITEHPDWFSGEAWGNIAFDWSNAELREWFTDTLVKNILTTDADGYRCDCEPNYTRYDIYGEVRSRLAEKGKFIAIISEDTSTRKSVYDFEQDGVLDYASLDRAMLYSNPVNFFTDGYLDIVDSVKTGKGIGSYNRDGKILKRGTSKYYTNCITNHDYQKRNVCGNRLKIGYSAILAPFIPIWYMGDEFNAQCVDGVQYDIPVNFSDCEKTSNAFFFEDVKKMIEIRREYGNIFERWTNSHRNSNICEVKVCGMDSLQNYARYADNQAVLVIANNNPDTLTGTVDIPFSKCEIGGYRTYKLTDLMTGRTLLTGTKSDIDGFTAFVPYQHDGVFLVEGENEKVINFNIANLFSRIEEKIISAFLKIAAVFSR